MMTICKNKFEINCHIIVGLFVYNKLTSAVNNYTNYVQ